MTCLHLAAKCGSVDTVKYLVEMTDTDINIKAGFNVFINLILFCGKKTKCMGPYNGIAMNIMNVVVRMCL